MREARDARAWRLHVLALAAYTLCALAVTYPLVTRLTTHFVANEFGQVDGFLSIWNLWWAAEALRTGQNPFHTPMLFHPQGLDLFWLWLSFPNGLLAAPLTLALGPLVAYNLTILGSYVLGGYCAFLFIRRYVRDGAAALVGGALYALTPFHMRRVLDAVMDTAAIQWVPLYLLALHWHLERPRWWKALLCGALVLWVGLGSWYYGLFCLIYTGMAALVWAVRESRGTAGIRAKSKEQRNKGTKEQGNRLPATVHRPNRHQPPATSHQPSSIVPQPPSIADRPSPETSPATSHQLPATSHRPSSVIHRPSTSLRTLLWGLAPGVVWAALVAPQLIALVQDGDRLLGVGLHANDSNSADLVDFFLPNPFHPLWGAAVSAWHARIRPDAWLWQVSFGWVALGLALAGWWAQRRALWPWLALLLGTMLLATGERLYVLGQPTGIPMPYALLAGLPGIRTSHRPNHILLIGALLLALVAAHGAAALFRRLPRARWGLAAGLVAAALLVDGLAPVPLYSLPIPEGYAAGLPAHTGGAILPIPVNLNVARGEQLWYQTAHGWPIIGGYTGREPPYPLGKYAPGVRELRYGRAEPDDIVSPGWPTAAREMLSALDVRYIAFHPDLMKGSIERERALIAQLGLTPSYSDARLELYPVPPSGQPRVIGYLGNGWGGLEREGDRRWRWLGDGPGELYLYNPHAEPRSVTLDLQIEAFGRDRPLAVSVDGRAPATITATRAEMRRSLRILLGPGEHVVYFSAPADPPETRSGPARSVSFLGIGVGE